MSQLSLTKLTPVYTRACFIVVTMISVVAMACFGIGAFLVAVFLACWLVDRVRLWVSRKIFIPKSMQR